MARPKEVACCVCGCTQHNACAMGCSWVRAEPPLCSNPICQLIDALETEAAWLWDDLHKGKGRPLSEKRKALRAIRKLVKNVKAERGELG